MIFTDRPKWKRLAVAILCVAGLLAIAGGSFAAYSSQAYQRGVARNRDTETIRFTSNYLQTYAKGASSNSFTGKMVYFGDSQSTSDAKLEMYLDIYNYANGNENLVSQRDIIYDMTITFAGGSGAAQQYGVTCEGASVTSSGLTYTVKNQTLTGRRANFHRYKITFPESDLDKVKITATAIPTDASASITNNQMLAAILIPCTGTSTSTFSAEGKFIDESENTKPGEYDGFNYEISITSGTATGTLKWNDCIEIDTFFLKNLGKTDEDIKKILEEHTMMINMDQNNGTGDYLIAFYIKDKNKFPKSWDEMNKCITFSAEQTQN